MKEEMKNTGFFRKSAKENKLKDIKTCVNGHKMIGIGFDDCCPECEARWRPAKQNWEKEFDEKYHYQDGVELLLKSPNHFQTYDVTSGIKSFISQAIQAARKEERQIAYQFLRAEVKKAPTTK